VKFEPRSRTTPDCIFWTMEQTRHRKTHRNCRPGNETFQARSVACMGWCQERIPKVNRRRLAAGWQP